VKKILVVLIGLVFLASMGLNATFRYPSNSSLGYRGVVFANGNNLNGPGQEIFVDFASVGVWAYDDGWHQLSGVNPDWIIAATLDNVDTDQVVGGFGSLGLWIWEYNGYPGNWTQLSGVNPKWAFACDDDADGLDELFADFGTGYGVWRYDYSLATWTQITALDATNGRRAYRWDWSLAQAILSFPTVGVWEISWQSGAAQYCQLTGTVTAEDDHTAGRFMGGSVEDLVIDFGTLGLWVLQNKTYSPWSRITPLGVNRLRTIKLDGQDKLFLGFDSVSGLYWWDGLGCAATNIHKVCDTDPDTGFCERFDMNGDTETNGDEEVAVDFGTNGLWVYDHTDGSWTQLSTVDPVFMISGDYWNEGYMGTLVVDFGAYGLWRYHAKDKTWDLLSGLSPDEALN
jgi:hypothetical protein